MYWGCEVWQNVISFTGGKSHWDPTIMGQSNMVQNTMPMGAVYLSFARADISGYIYAFFPSCIGMVVGVRGQ